MKLRLIALLLLGLQLNLKLYAADYVIDTKGMHASIQFKISHLGISWLTGGFDKFSGEYSFDAKKPNESKISVTVETNSVNSNHAERDKHLRSDDFLDVEKYPQATFVSETFTLNSDDTGSMTGKLNLHGVEKTIEVAIVKVGEGVDPWGGYRTGFEGKTSLTLADFGITKNLGKASKTLELHIFLEGKRKK